MTKNFNFILTFKDGEKIKLAIAAEDFEVACMILFKNKYIIFDNLWAFTCEESNKVIESNKGIISAKRA